MAINAKKSSINDCYVDEQIDSRIMVNASNGNFVVANGFVDWAENNMTNKNWGYTGWMLILVNQYSKNQK